MAEDTNAFDINDPRFQGEDEGEVYDINPEADAFSGPPPVPDGRYEVKLSIQDDKANRYEIKKGANIGKSFYGVNLELTVVDPDGEFDNRKVFYSANTMVQRDSNTSTIAGLLVKLGAEVPRRTSDTALIRLLSETLEADPTVGIKTQWRASVKQDDGKYKTVKRGMRAFPQFETEEGEPERFNPFVEDPSTGEQVRARAEVVGFFTIED